MKKLNKKDMARVSLVVLAIISIPIMYLAYKNEKFLEKPSSYNAEISLVDGQVEKSTKGTWSKVVSGDSISQADSLRVVGEGKAIVTLDDGSAVRLNSDSTFRLVSLNPKNIQIANEGGELYSRVIKADRSFKVLVDDEGYEAMGTAYKTINATDKKGVYVYESKVKTKGAEVPEGKKFYQKNATEEVLVDKVVDLSTEEVEKDKFVQWNKEQDLKKEEYKKHLGILDKKTNQPEVMPDKPTASPDPIAPKTPAPTPVPTKPISPTVGITLSGFATTKGIDFKWSVSGVDTSKGFKLVRDTKVNPLYPNNSVAYIKAGVSNYSMNLTDGVTYNFRICQYTGSGCGVYSNNIVVTAPKVSSSVTKIDLYTYGTGQVKWLTTGVSSGGFKLVWSKNSGATYPSRTGDKSQYYSDPASKIGTIDAFDGPGTYFIRVCAYLNGACGIYSNEIQINL